ncbi:MAG: hypothetical protein ABI193_21715 [Minicystis sp.]
MRIHAYALLTFLATGAAGAVAACSGEVATTTNSSGTTAATTTTGAGGTGGTSTTTAVTTGTTTVAATTTTGGGGQAGDPKCIQTCDKGDMCGFGLCDQFGVDCTNPPAQLTPCLEDCIIGADCGDLAKAANMDFNTPFGACAGGCMGMGNTTGAGGGPMDGGPPPSCQKCAQDSCGPSVQACITDFGSGCPQWLQCIQNCADDACYLACDAAHMPAKAKYEPLYACICASCMDSCTQVDSCSHVPDGG